MIKIKELNGIKVFDSVDICNYLLKNMEFNYYFDNVPGLITWIDREFKRIKTKNSVFYEYNEEKFKELEKKIAILIMNK